MKNNKSFTKFSDGTRTEVEGHLVWIKFISNGLLALLSNHYNTTWSSIKNNGVYDASYVEEKLTFI